MKSSPLKAFEKFLELTSDRKKVYNINEELIDEVIKPFLANPEQHLEHVKIMTEARWVIHFTNILYAAFPKPIRSLLLRLSEWPNEYFERINKLKAELLKTTEPASLSIDILPSRILETPPEWTKLNKQIHLIEIRTAINPSENLLPNSFDLKIDFEAKRSVQLIESFPSTDFSEAGNYKVGMSKEGKFISSSKIGGELKIGGEYKGASAKIDLEKSKTNEQISTQKVAYEFQYSNKVLKIISSSVGKTAIWKLLRTTDHFPIGGLNFYLSILAPKDLNELGYTAKLTSEIETWGPISIDDSGTVLLTKN
jgi:hypothetical protein